MNPVEAVSPPSGAQHEIRHGSHRAIVTEVGATLRHYSVEDADIIDGFGVEEWSPSGPHCLCVGVNKSSEDVNAAPR